LDVPWLRLAAVAAVALVAGVAASVLPARRAGRISPAAGLTDG
jgi:putative ABC transport system permease protein